MTAEQQEDSVRVESSSFIAKREVGFCFRAVLVLFVSLGSSFFGHPLFQDDHPYMPGNVTDWKTNWETRATRGMTSGLLFDRKSHPKTTDEVQWHKQDMQIKPEGPLMCL